MLYPLIFKPILKEKIWGGRGLKSLFNRELPEGKFGESWDVSCHKNGISVVSMGEYKDLGFDDLIKKFGRELLGTKMKQKDMDKFPLLIKILDANEVLSVQVHPSDEYAARHEKGELGKTEMWYILHAQPGAFLYYGINPGIDADKFESAMLKGDVEPYLGKMPVQEGDVIYIPAGTVHAIGAGIILCEIQQNSDTTYRVFDWNRVGDDGNPRELHIDKALEVIDFKGEHPKDKVRGIRVKESWGEKTYLAACPYFAVEKLDIKDSMGDMATGEKFFILTVVRGEGFIDYNRGKQPFKAGDSIMIPASLGEYMIQGDCTILKTYIPNRERDIILPLENKGFSLKEMEAIAGLFNL